MSTSQPAGSSSCDQCSMGDLRASTDTIPFSAQSVPTLKPTGPDGTSTGSISTRHFDRVYVCASVDQKITALSYDLSYDASVECWFTVLGHPRLIEQLLAFGLRPPDARTLAEMSSALLGLCVGVKDPDLRVLLASERYVQQLRGPPISFFVSPALFDPKYNLYLRTLLRHVHASFNSASPYQDRVLDVAGFHRMGYSSEPPLPDAETANMIDVDSVPTTDDEQDLPYDEHLPRDVDRFLQREDRDNATSSAPTSDPLADQENRPRFTFMRTAGNDSEPDNCSEPDCHSSTSTVDLGLALVKRLEQRLVQQTVICEELFRDKVFLSQQLADTTIGSSCLLFSSASRAGRNVQLTVEAAVRYRTRLELDIPEPSKLAAKLAEAPFVKALSRIANAEHWKRDDLRDELESPYSPSRSGPTDNYTDTHRAANQDM